MSAAALIRIDDVWKSYPCWPGERTLRGTLTRRLPLAARRGERTWALQQVSLSVAPGEAVGLIGQNGAGKSTLLRLAAGLGRPTRGRVEVDGQVAAVLSLGDSFDLSLSGVENAYTAAVVAGLRRSEARAILPAAIEFAELEGFAEAPMRTYSDGMRLRLAFGVVAQLRPRVLIVDEVIAVGDLRFQARCLDRIRELRADGTAVLLASHSLDTVVAECDRAVWLHAGRVRRDAPAAEATGLYADAMRSETMARTPAAAAGGPAGLELGRDRWGSLELTIERVSLPETVESGGPLRVELEIASQGGYEVMDPMATVTISRTSDGVVCCDLNSEAAGVRLGRVGEDGLRLALEIERLDLAPGDYLVDAGVYTPTWEYAYDFHSRAYPLRVSGRSAGSGLFSPAHRWDAAAVEREGGAAVV